MTGNAVLLGILVLAVGAGAIMISVAAGFRRSARKAGYASVGEFLRAAPQTDEERRDAVDLALRGLVICLLAVIFPPLLVVGIFPLFYGARKVAYASIGLGLVDDAGPSSG